MERLRTKDRQVRSKNRPCFCNFLPQPRAMNYAKSERFSPAHRAVTRFSYYLIAQLAIPCGWMLAQISVSILHAISRKDFLAGLLGQRGHSETSNAVSRVFAV